MSNWVTRELESIRENSDDEKTYLIQLNEICGKVFVFMADTLSQTCIEKGELLKKVWKDYSTIMEEKITKAFSKSKTRDKELTNMAESLLIKYKQKILENKDEFNVMKKLVSDYENELLSLRATIGRLKDKIKLIDAEREELSNENFKLKVDFDSLRNINKALREYFLSFETKAGTLIIYQ